MSQINEKAVLAQKRTKQIEPCLLLKVSHAVQRITVCIVTRVKSIDPYNIDFSCNTIDLELF